ncbi:alpha-1,6-mannosylglycoprotein 6-beta-N-acetylglucosaminyltransferase A-like [Clavelina lepadiformis]|uniref:alpha-1,6-mannosylglycoprotein 6-beta-N-acetylglucosaminyltransferase A-like n=1 Tax=Clavelina lepadiformis TaxID=159417 RepID=UPI004042D18D
MYLSFYALKRSVALIAICWSLVLFAMHRRLLTQHNEREQLEVRSLAGGLMHISCGKNEIILRDRHCIKRVKWVAENWQSHGCFSFYGVNSTETDLVCSVYRYLVYVERACPSPNEPDTFFSNVLPSPKAAKQHLQLAEVRNDLTSLISKLEECGSVCKWIGDRVKAMVPSWTDTSKTVSKMMSLGATEQNIREDLITNKTDWFNPNEAKDFIGVGTPRIKLTILLHMGLLTKAYGLNFGEAAWVGGPLGELVQWSDLMAALHILGHDIILSWSPERLKEIVSPHRNRFDTCKPSKAVDLIFTDITGIEQIREALGTLFHYRCLLRVLDVYGTDPEYNHPKFNPDKANPAARTWGSKGLNPAQFFTHFPHSPDNSFMGFVVNADNDGPSVSVETDSKSIALLYGKRTEILDGGAKLKYIDKIYKYFDEMHATMWRKDKGDEYDVIPNYVINHKNMEQSAFLDLLDKASVYVGVGTPVEGPAALEAIAKGVVFLNPKFNPPRHVTQGKPTARTLTSQNPYAENRIGKPHVYTINIRNLTDIEVALKKIKESPRPKPYVPHEFTRLGFLERVNAYIENQDFCSETLRTHSQNAKVIWIAEKKRWPPKSSLQIRLSNPGESCTAACTRHDLICERNFFQDINSTLGFRLRRQPCPSERTIFPLQEYHQIRKRIFSSEFAIPCHAPSYDAREEECLLQSDELLYSCACTPPIAVSRLCPCREVNPRQTALCDSCL